MSYIIIDQFNSYLVDYYSTQYDKLKYGRSEYDWAWSSDYEQATRHQTREECLATMRRCGLREIKRFSQDVYYGETTAKIMAVAP